MNLSELSDESIAVMVREENKELFGELIQRYQLKLTHYLRKFIYSPDELEDVLQVVFIKTFQNLYGFNKDQKFSSWIYRIAHNEAVNSLKKNSRHMLSLDDEEYRLIDEKINLPKLIDGKILQTKMEKALVQLKDKYREVLVLYFFEQKTYEEISDILRVPMNTVGTLLSRGKSQLKSYLEN